MGRVGTVLCGVALVVSSLAGGERAASAASLGVEFTGAAVVEQAQDDLVGWSFTATQELLLTALGVYDNDFERRHEAPHLVGLWNVSGVLLSSATIHEALGGYVSPLEGTYHFEAVAPISLQAGQTYVVAATLGYDSYTYAVAGSGTQFSGLQFSPYVTFGAEAHTYGTRALAFPTASEARVVGGFGANFRVTPVPLPGTLPFLVSGLLGLAGLRRRKG